MGAKKRNAAVDRQPRLVNVKTRLTGNKTGAVSTPAKPQKQAAKAASKKSLPIKKRIPKEKPGNEELSQDSNPRLTIKSKKVESEPCTSSSTEVTINLKLSECNNETEVDTKLTVKDGKTKAISKMLKSLDIQISGFDNILPPEEKIIEVLKSSISENVKTKSRASAFKLSNTSAINKCAAKKEEVEKKAGQLSSNSSSPHASFEQSTKDGAASKKEVSVGSMSETVASTEDKAFKETSEELEEPIIETKKKIAAKKAKLEANRNKKTQEERKEEDKLSQPQELHKPLNIVYIHPDQTKYKTEQDKKKHVKPKSSQLATEGEISEDREGQTEIEASRHMKPAKYCDKESTVITKDEASQLKKNNTKTLAGFEDPIEKNITEQVKDEADENKTKHMKSIQEKGRDNSAQRKDEDSTMKKKQIKSSRLSQNTNVERESSEQGKYEEIQDKKKTAEFSKFNKKESLEQNKEETEENKERQIKAGKCSQQNTEVEKEVAVVSVSSKPSSKIFTSPKKNKLLKGKCNDDGIKLSQVKTDQVSSTKESNIKVPSVTFDDTESSSLKETPKKAKSLTILQRLQNKYKMSPVKSKPLGPVKPTKKGETKSSTKKLHIISAEEQKTNDIYDFKSGSESEENIKMELPTLKKLREFSDDDDKPLQVAKKKVKEDEKVAEAISKKPEPKGETSKIEKSNIKTAPKHPIAEKKSASKVGRKPVAKIKRPPTESSSDEKSSTTTDSEDEQKLSTFGQKRHRMASLNAAAKVQCLYENESRTAYELGLSKTVQIVPKIRNINSGSSSEDEHETNPTIKKEAIVAKKVEILKTEPVEEAAEDEKEAVEVKTKRELRNVPGRGMGKHWEFESDTDNEAIFIEKLRLKKKKLQKLKALQAKKEKKEKDKDNEKSEEKFIKPKKTIKPPKKHLKVKIASSDDGSSESSEYEDKKKPLNAPAEKSSSEVKKKRKRELKEELIGDYKGILARKRMASLNASAIVAATYEVERHLDRNFASDCSSFESFPEEEKHISKKSKKQVAVTSQPPPPPASQPTQVKLDTKDLKEVKEIKIDRSECSDTKDSFKDSLQDTKETTRPTSSLVIVQDTDVTITGVYVNPTTGSSQEAYCKMQYRVQSSVTEERVLRPGSVEPPKSYTPLGALSSMKPPGAATGTDERSTPPISADSGPPIAESINHPIIYQPNDSSHHDPSEHSHYSFHHHMSPSPLSLHPHPADHTSQMHHYGDHQPGPDPAPQALSAHHYHTPQQSAQPSSASAQGRCESPVRYGGVYQAQHPTLSITAGGGSSAFCAPPNLQQQQHHDMSGHLTKVSFTRMFVLQHWLNANGTEKNKSHSILDIISKSLHDIPNADYKVLETRIVYVCKKLTYFWKKTCRKRCLLVKNYLGWLNTKEVCIISENNNYLPYSTSAGRPSTSAGRPSTSAGQPSTSAGRPSTSAGQPSTSGRPFKDFAESSKRSKRRRLATLSEVDSSAVDYLLNNSNTPIKRPDNEEVLSLITETKLSKNQYLLLRDFINLYTSSEFLPSYQKIIQTKKLCYPENEKNYRSVCRSRTSNCKVYLTIQPSVYWSRKKLFCKICHLIFMILFGKWGFDGSTGQSEYKQSFLESNADDDSSLFVTSFVPLRLKCEKSNQVFWKNPRPSSTRYCRPIRFRFAKETKELSLQEEAYIKNQISNLNPFIFEEENIQVRITYSLQLTMVDGKVCCALSETATSKCYICGASPKEMNNIEKCLEKPVNECKYEFAISPLHSWIRFFEFCIHLSYRLHIQKWQMRSDEDKASFAENTFRIRFGRNWGLLSIDREVEEVEHLMMETRHENSSQMLQSLLKLQESIKIFLSDVTQY